MRPTPETWRKYRRVFEMLGLTNIFGFVLSLNGLWASPLSVSDFLGILVACVVCGVIGAIIAARFWTELEPETFWAYVALAAVAIGLGVAVPICLAWGVLSALVFILTTMLLLNAALYCYILVTAWCFRRAVVRGEA